jgi:Fur family peroxide stress response transcriptional regulator
MKTLRNTKYSEDIIKFLGSNGHATNLEIIESLRIKYPRLSATTVHRVTSRLCENGLINEAPPDLIGSMRFDSNLTPHDHFICMNCGGIRDIYVAEEFIPRISEALGGCKVTGRLVINGSCELCLKKLTKG